MQRLRDAIDYLYTTILDEKKDIYRHKNLILVGNNASGKSRCLESILKKSISLSPKDIYFIDSKNRVMVEKNKAFEGRLRDLSVEKIVDYRLGKEIFLCQDVFINGCSGGDVAYNELHKDIENERILQSLYADLLGLNAEIRETEEAIGDWMKVKETHIVVNESVPLERLATSEASKMRILMEVEFASQKDVKAIIIDEFDAYFSEDTVVDFMNMLINRYDKIRFIFVIHSISTIFRIEDMDIALIFDEYKRDVLDNMVEYMDSNNVDSFAKIERIRDLITCEMSRKASRLESIVDEIVHERNVRPEIAHELNLINRSELKAKDKILYDYAIEYIKKYENKTSNTV